MSVVSVASVLRMTCAMRAVPARVGGHDAALAAPECAATAGGMHAARSGRPGHALLPQVCPSATCQYLFLLHLAFSFRP